MMVVLELKLISARVLRNDSTKSSKSNSRGDEIDDSSEAYVSSYQSVNVKKTIKAFRLWTNDSS